MYIDINPENLATGSYGDAENRTLKNRMRLQITEHYNEEIRRLEWTWTLHRRDNTCIKRSYSVSVYSHNEMENLLTRLGFQYIEILNPENSCNQEVIYTEKKKL
uniref:Uncharacterized protein n=1 Tax=Candidatus Kentrum sp. TC TaxID=2126339 RepID=A0A450Z114_9GAMM|nr:MAG: hypothetical protein BECKTC1821D_GA0114238_10477 [Candidatus Kentron sp. TC]VFK60465.1 MAG: hypothetical protein BECKTC1821F_GA0114240_10468 [Candidatus Kentron sp. TC]